MSNSRVHKSHVFLKKLLMVFKSFLVFYLRDNIWTEWFSLHCNSAKDNYSKIGKFIVKVKTQKKIRNMKIIVKGKTQKNSEILTFNI